MMVGRAATSSTVVHTGTPCVPSVMITCGSVYGQCQQGGGYRASYEQVCRAHPRTYIRLGCVPYDFGLCGRRATNSLMEGPVRTVSVNTRFSGRTSAPEVFYKRKTPC